MHLLLDGDSKEKLYESYYALCTLYKPIVFDVYFIVINVNA